MSLLSIFRAWVSVPRLTRSASYVYTHTTSEHNIIFNVLYVL